MSTHAIHHVTAVTANIAENMRYYTEVLGLRLVKRSVNQDDVRAYHLFYADSVGTPGTDLTFFDWPTIGPNTPGYASIALTSFRAPTGSLDWWESRLLIAGSTPLRGEDGELGWIRFTDPEGQRLEIVEEAGWPSKSKPWTRIVSQDHALTGILGVSLESARPEATRRVLTEILDYKEVSEGRFIADGDGVFGRITLIEPSASFGRLGAGGVHHVAFRVSDDVELRDMQRRIEALDIRTSGYVDRFWFHSLYFREPGGVLFELATDGPGFGTDEALEHLGERLVLPPFLEGRRAEIEAGLKPLPDAIPAV